MSYVDSTAASTTQVIYELFCMMGVTIDKQIANCLYTGLCTDTGCFRYSNTSATTLRIAASLMDAGADVAEINRIMFDTKSRARLNVERLAMESITFYENGRFDIMEITEEMMKQSGATEGDIEGLAALPRQVEGVLIAATLREKKEGGYKISVRATPPYDASAICSQFGGGGHKGAAGCVIEDEKETVKKRLAEAVSNYFRSQGIL
ncbi:MAG: DHH family phosphoesterase [Eubacteriales bacterium]